VGALLKADAHRSGKNGGLDNKLNFTHFKSMIVDQQPTVKVDHSYI